MYWDNELPEQAGEYWFYGHFHGSNAGTPKRYRAFVRETAGGGLAYWFEGGVCPLKEYIFGLWQEIEMEDPRVEWHRTVHGSVPEAPFDDAMTSFFEEVLGEGASSEDWSFHVYAAENHRKGYDSMFYTGTLFYKGAQVLPGGCTIRVDCRTGGYRSSYLHVGRGSHTDDEGVQPPDGVVLPEGFEAKYEPLYAYLLGKVFKGVGASVFAYVFFGRDAKGDKAEHVFDAKTLEPISVENLFPLENLISTSLLKEVRS